MSIIKRAALATIKFYQRTISPDHGVFSLAGANICRFYPSCSQYAYESIEKNGLAKGLTMGVWRVLRCSPLSKGGVDLPR